MKGSRLMSHSTDLMVNDSEIIWEHRIGRHGRFDLAQPQKSPQFERLLQAISERGGSYDCDDLHFWLIGSCIARRLKNPESSV